ncbi:hypothetical protein G7B40_025725 [Aetokthonos hydrillicola Thurmond2011]|uniref:Uncharacterized protein n=1 Tax=Aetokthonos hydrillicola Thurmond2011 TaxID=2712845 RepID=A0AAP5MA98_9CYAN|nr:hypothetical protein [Aetokthonos hydrillicola]MBO3460685.1 hypothetical protein [Aetokthonos hydrillicola CCALA 1050]MBW4587683.1 hypothetical protein [Aetokthonos hydrillicola CCALA 1050]MDR9897935.1 hypothetical protein [Aetokthonos hydrillicola Thurmond2011]
MESSTFVDLVIEIHRDHTFGRVYRPSDVSCWLPIEQRAIEEHKLKLLIFNPENRSRLNKLVKT